MALRERVERWVVLLRAINVGGNNKLPMADLAEILRGLGASSIRTYIQSGNAVLDAPASVAAALPARLSAALLETKGFSVPVVTRSAVELVATRDRNPFVAEGCDPATLHVAFLAQVPAGEKRSGFDPDRSPGDRVALAGRDLYLHLPNGVGKSKLTNEYLDRAFGTVATIRNWRTVLALCEMCST